MAAIGSRVGAISHAGAGTIAIFGYGVYQGDVIPDPALGVKIFGEPMDHPNPCILLDSGKQVFGCECWWGPEETVKAHVAAFEAMTVVDIEEARRENSTQIDVAAGADPEAASSS